MTSGKKVPEARPFVNPFTGGVSYENLNGFSTELNVVETHTLLAGEGTGSVLIELARSLESTKAGWIYGTAAHDVHSVRAVLDKVLAGIAKRQAWLEANDVKRLFPSEFHPAVYLVVNIAEIFNRFTPAEVQDEIIGLLNEVLYSGMACAVYVLVAMAGVPRAGDTLRRQDFRQVVEFARPSRPGGALCIVSITEK